MGQGREPAAAGRMGAWDPAQVWSPRGARLLAARGGPAPAPRAADIRRRPPRLRAAQPARRPRPHGPVRAAGGRRPGAVPAAGAAGPRVVQAGGRARLLLGGPRGGAAVRLPQVPARAPLRAPRERATPGPGERRRRAAPPPAEPRECGRRGWGGGVVGGREGGCGARGRARGGPSASSRPQAACVKDVSPKLRSCARFPDGRATVQCQADVFLSLRAADCRSA